MEALTSSDLAPQYQTAGQWAESGFPSESMSLTTRIYCLSGSEVVLNTCTGGGHTEIDRLVSFKQSRERGF